MDTIYYKKNQKGLTIIELVVAIAIIGILSLILIPKFSSLVQTTEETSNEQISLNTKEAIRVAIASGDLVICKDSEILMMNTEDGYICIPSNNNGLKGCNGVCLNPITLTEIINEYIPPKTKIGDSSIVFTLSADGKIKSKIKK